MANEHLKLTPIDDPKDRVEIEVGDSKQPDFIPQVKAMRWDNEVNFSVRYIDAEGDNTYYDVENGYEFEVVFQEKPQSNVVRFSLQSKGLDFFYQPELTQEEIDGGAYRPENVVGSYAVYHKTKGGLNRADGMKYRAGKAFHIYRPHVTDANGDRIWADLDITGNSMTITIDQDWLDNAVYPVVVDPTFGYTSQGGTLDSRISYDTAHSDYGAMKAIKGNPGEAGTADSLSIYINHNVDADIQGAIYPYETTGGITITSSDYKTDSSTVTADGWKTINFSTPPSLSANDYWLFVKGENQTTSSYSSNLGTYYDSGATNEALIENSNGDTNSGMNIYDYLYITSSDGTPEDAVQTIDRKYSIYATYTASATDPEPNVNDSITLTENSTTLINQLVPTANDSVTLSESSSVTVNAPVAPTIDTNDSITVTESSDIVLLDPGVIIYDRFIGTDSDDVTGRTPDTVDNGNNWADIADRTGTAGGGEIQSNTLSLTNNQGGQGITTGYADCIIQYDWTPAVGVANRNSLVFRYSNNNNFWMYNHREDNGDWQLIKIESGLPSTIDSALYTLNEGTTYQIKVILNGSSIKGYIDGNETFNETDAYNLTQTTHGVIRNSGDNATQIDNFILIDFKKDVSKSDNISISESSTVNISSVEAPDLQINIAGYTGVRVF